MTNIYFPAGSVVGRWLYGPIVSYDVFTSAPAPHQIIYVTNTIHSSGELQYLAEGAGAGLFLVGLGICVALIMWGLRKLIE